MNKDQLPKDFSSSETNNQLQQYLQSKEVEFQSKMRKRHKSQLSLSWVIISVLLITLVGLGSLSVREIQKGNQTISQLSERQSQVAGVTNRPYEQEPVTGFGFAILPDQEIPQEFSQQRQIIDSPYFEGREQVQSSFLATLQTPQEQLRSGLSIGVLEYDNQLNHEEFSNLVATTLGQDFEVEEEVLVLAKDFKLQKVSNPLSSLTYYTAITTDNYYIITIYDDLEGRDEYAEINQVTDNLLGWLYLN
jgi:hypothetical protein